MPKDVLIRATGRYLPERVFTNEEYTKFLDTSNEWIVERTGITERRMAAPGETASEMGLHASLQCLERAGVAAEDVELIVVPTVTPDTVFPATANWLQGKLGNKRAWSFDLNAGCSGFVYALNVIANILRTGQHRYALLVGSEKMTALSDMTDREHCVLFGDAAAAILLEAVDPADNPEGYGLREFYMQSDGELASILMQHAGGSSLPATYTTVHNHRHFISMQGREVYKHAVRRMYHSVIEVLERAKVHKDDVDWFIGHQANARIIEATQKRLEVPAEKVYMNVQRYGNTTSATIPLCLDELYCDGKLADGQNIVLFTFGTGFTWGSCFVKWGGVK
jgi:3-oxoacyl-[acyl-carrier-protein] synthase-3